MIRSSAGEFYMVASCFELDVLRDLATFEEDWLPLEEETYYALDVTDLLRQGLDGDNPEMDMLNDLATRCLDQLRVSTKVYEVADRWQAELLFFPFAHNLLLEQEKVQGAIYVTVAEGMTFDPEVNFPAGDGLMYVDDDTSDPNLEMQIPKRSLILRFRLFKETP